MSNDVWDTAVRETRDEENQRLQFLVTAWAVAFDQFISYLKDRVAVRDEANPAAYLEIIQKLCNWVKPESQRLESAARREIEALQWVVDLYDGVPNRENIASELADYRALLGEVPLVYAHVTGGRISKVQTLAREVIAQHDDRRSEDIEDAIKEDRELREGSATAVRGETNAPNQVAAHLAHERAAPSSIRRFTMYRRGDLSATHTNDQRNGPDEPQFEGVVFTDGSCALRWCTACRSTSVWSSFEDAMRIHGHPEYDSELVWHEPL